MSPAAVLSLDYVPLSEVLEAPRNPKGHDEPGIRASIERHGFVEPAIHDRRTGRILGGHGRAKVLRAMQAEGAEPPANILVLDSGDWAMPVVFGHESADDAEAEALLISLNGLTEAGGIAAPDMLIEMLDALHATPLGLAGTGYEGQRLDELLDTLAPPPAADDLGSSTPTPHAEDATALLSLVDVSVGEPTHAVEPGQRWQLGESHTLVTLDIMRDHARWVPLLDDPEVLLIPYPGPFLILSARFRERRTLLIQPDLYLAGHLLDKYASVHDDAPVLIGEV